MNESQANVAPLPRRQNPKLGVWIFLGGEVIFFGVLILTYSLLRLRAPLDFQASRRNVNPPARRASFIFPKLVRCPLRLLTSRGAGPIAQMDRARVS